MTTNISPLLVMEPKRFSLQEVKELHEQMLALVESDKKMDMELMKLAPGPVNLEELWRTKYKDITEKLAENDIDDLFDEEVEAEQSSSEEEEFVEGSGARLKKPQSLTAAMQKQLSLLDKEKKYRCSRLDFFEQFLDVESKRNEILTEKVAMSARIKDVLEAELNSEEIIDQEEEPPRRYMISSMAKWWDCLLYNMSVELNQDMQDEEIGKWSELYLKWCLWIDLKAGISHDEGDDRSTAQAN